MIDWSSDVCSSELGDKRMLIAFALPIVPKLGNAFRQVGAVRYHRSAVTNGAQVLRRIEAVCSRCSEGASGDSIPAGQMRLGTILYQFDRMLTAQIFPTIHVADLPIQMDKYDRARARRNAAASAFDREETAVGLYVSQNGYCARAHDGKRSRERRHRCGDDLITISNFERAQDQFDRIHAVPNADRSEEHTSELQSLMRISYAVFCLKKKT